jgi:hypothetical protein
VEKRSDLKDNKNLRRNVTRVIEKREGEWNEVYETARLQNIFREKKARKKIFPPLPPSTRRVITCFISFLSILSVEIEN